RSGTRCPRLAMRRSSPTPRPTSSAARRTSDGSASFTLGRKRISGRPVSRSHADLPTMLSYKVQSENNSLYNTPNTFGVYILGLTMKWLKSLGGLAAIARVNERKAATLYAEVDRTGFYRGTAEKDSRSLMNVTFRLPSEALEKEF